MITQVRALRLAGRASVSPIFQARSARHGVFPKRHNSTVTGVSAVLQASETGPPPRPTLLSKEFSIEDRVALVSGGNGSIGLEMALALVEAGARAVYCVDLPQKPSEAWEKVRQYAKRMEGKAGEGRLEYIHGDVRDQEHMWKIGEQIGDKEGRLDIGIAAAGVFKPSMEPLSYPAGVFKEVMDVNINGALFTAQAAGRQMARFGSGGSIIMVASAGGYIAIKNIQQVSYNTSKAAVLQMTRSLACELAPQGIRVNALSPGWMRTNMTATAIDANSEYFNDMIPMGRVGLPHELRGATAWLASDSSSFCTGSSILVDGALCAQ